MSEKKEISVELWNIEDDCMTIEFYHQNQLKAFSCEMSVFKTYILENDLLHWYQDVRAHNNEHEEKEGWMDIDTYIKERIDYDVIKDFVISEMKKFVNG